MRLTTVGRVARNSVAMTGALLIKRASHFVLYILVARHLGVLVFGQFSLAYTFFLIFQVPAMFGLFGLIVREVAKNKSDFDKYLVNGHVIVLAASLASLSIWISLVHLLGYSPQVIEASYLLGLALIPFAMRRVCEAIFQAFERMQFIVYAFAIANLAMIGLVWLLLSRGFSVSWVIGLLVIIEGTMLLLEWYFIYRYFPKPSLVIDLDFCRKLAKVATTFLGISVFSVIFVRMNIIILSKLRGEAEVGLYNAAFQLTYVFVLISLSLQQAIYPVLSRTYKANLARFKQYTERSIELLISIGLPLAVGFFFLADSILLVYRAEFVTAAPAMRIIGWILVPLSFNRILGGVLLASGQQRVNLLLAIVNAATLFLLSIILTHNFGLMGAGVALLASFIISAGLCYAAVSRRIFSVSIPRITWKTIVSSLFLTGFLAFMGQNHTLLIIIPLAILLYGAVLLSLNLVFGGPLRSVRAWRLREKSKPGVGGAET